MSDWKHIDERFLEGRRRHVLEARGARGWELALGGLGGGGAWVCASLVFLNREPRNRSIPWKGLRCYQHPI